jgi:hypothetical protein
MFVKRRPFYCVTEIMTGVATFSSKQLLSCTLEAEWTPLQLLRKSGSARNRTRTSGSVVATEATECGTEAANKRKKCDVVFQFLDSECNDY